MDQNQENAQLSERGTYADSMDAAAGSLGRSVAFLQRLKAMGCPAFRGSRVYLKELEDYIAENNLESLEQEVLAAEAINVEIAKERLRKLRFANDVEEKRFILKADIADVALELASELKAVLRKSLEDEAPDQLAMKSREEVARICRGIVDQLCAKLARASWTRKKS